LSAAHYRRHDIFEHIRRFLKEKQKVTKKEFALELLVKKELSRDTIRRYMEDIVDMGIARNHGDCLEWVFDKKESK
jgi:predicted HTH transcriptional regulator